jgi:hypothetical protein
MKKLIVALAMLAPIAAIPTTFVPSACAAAQPSALGDLSAYETIAKDTLELVEENDLAAAQTRITDFEKAWDKAEPTLYPMNNDQWGHVDDAADGAISALRTNPAVQADARTAVTALIAALQDPAGQ